MTISTMAEHCYAECHINVFYAECHYAECRGAVRLGWTSVTYKRFSLLFCNVQCQRKSLDALKTQVWISNFKCKCGCTTRSIQGTNTHLKYRPSSGPFSKKIYKCILAPKVVILVSYKRKLFITVTPRFLVCKILRNVIRCCGLYKVFWMV
jgi:hypothetical protein